MASNIRDGRKVMKGTRSNGADAALPVPAVPLPARWIDRYHRIYPDVSPDLARALFAVRSTALVLDNAITARLAKVGLTSARYHLLVVVWGWDGPISFSDLGAYLTITRATVSALVESLVQDNIVARSVDPKDRRNALISLTAHGEKMLKPLLDANFADMHLAFADFTESDLADLLALLAKFQANAQRLLITEKRTTARGQA